MTEFKNRWKGLRSYDEEDCNFFCGREEEAEQLFRMVMRETLTTIFAPSGTGKTSLLQAGLFPKLRESGYFPIRIRLDHSTDGLDLARFVRDAIEREAERIGLEGDSCVEPLVGPDEESLWEYMHRVEFWDKDYNILTPIIVLDQFEEVFTLGRARPESERFLQELADLIEKRMPNRVRERLNESGERRRIPLDFQGFKIILALRQDFVAQLDDLRQKMPSVMHNRYPLHEFSSDQALQAVMGPGEGVVSKPVAQQIVRVLGKTKGTEESAAESEWDSLRIEPSLLSLVCSELDKQRINNRDAEISAHQLESQRDHIIRDFYERSFEGLGRKVRIFVEDKLLTATGYRKSQPLDDALEEGLTVEARRRLIDRHVIRKVDNRDITHIELTHDLLCPIVKESRDRRHEKEETEELRRTRRIHRRKMQFFATTTAVLIALSLVTVKMMLDARKSEQLAEQQTLRADASAHRANELMDYMTDDLYDRLMPIGRLDLLESVALRAQEHYDQLESTDATPESSIARAGVLSKIADVLARRGNLSQALETHERAIEYLAAGEYAGNLEERRQEVLSNSLLDYAQTHTRWGSATAALSLLDRAAQIADAQPGVHHDDPLWRHRWELTRSKAMLRLGRAKDAMELLGNLQVVEQSQDSGLTPQRLAIMAETNQTHASLHRQRGDYSKAFHSQRAALAMVQKLLQDWSNNEEWLVKKVDVLSGLAQLHIEIGDFEGGIDKLQAAIAIASLQSARSVMTSDLTGKQWLLTKSILTADLAELWIRRDEAFHRDGLDESYLTQRTESSLQQANANFNSLAEQVGDELSDQFILAKSRMHALNSKYAELQGAFTDAKSHLDRGLAELENLGDAFARSTYAAEVHIEMILARGQLEERTTYRPTEPKQFAQALGLIQQLETDAGDNAVVAQLLARVYQGIGKAAQRRGQTRAATHSYQRVLEATAQVSAIDSGNRTLQRNFAYASIAFADFVIATGQSHEPDLSPTSNYRQGAELLQSLTETSEVFRLSDRLALLRASDLADGKAHQPIAAKEMYFPCIFTDSLAGDTSKQVKRRVFSPIMILVDLQRIDIEGFKPLEAEIARLNQDLLLELDQNLEQELINRYQVVKRAESKVVALAQFSDLEMSTLGSYGSEQGGLGLVFHSPVISHYPLRPPTVIGTECLLSWDFAGSAESIRIFQLQVATDADFNSLVVNTVTPGTHKRLDFSSTGELSKALNRKLYWRVRPVSADFNPQEESPKLNAITKWGPTQAVEVYASLWERVKAEKKIRVGISEFEGDLIELMEDSTIPSGFDGSVLKDIQSWLTKAYNRQVPEEDKLKDDELLELEIFKYSWDGMFGAVGRNEVELALSIITRTKEREARFGITFSEPYYETQLSAVFMKDRVQISSLEDIKSKKLVVNRNFRGHEIGKLIIGGEPEARSFANLPNLLRSLRSEGPEVALTDYAFIKQLQHIEDPSVKGIATYELTSKDFEDLLIKAKQADENSIVAKQLEAMFRDYGGARWEQYAVATSASDDGTLLGLINEAILDIRTREELARYCEASGLPIPLRLIGKNQLPEDIRHNATVFPLSIRTSSGSTTAVRASNDQVVMSSELKFNWQPLDRNTSGYYAIQIATSPLFEPNTVLFSKIIERTTISIDPEAVLPGGGEYYWRAKRVFSLDESQELVKSDFPFDGWCSPIRFQYWANCLDRIRTNKELLVAVNVANGYSVYRDPESHQAVGFDIDIANYIASELAKEFGLEEIVVKPVPMQFGEMFESVRNYETDIAMSGITSTEERAEEKQIAFSDPYCRTQQALVYIDQPDAGTSSWLSQSRVIGFKGTRAELMAKQLVHSDQIISPKYQPKPYLLEQILADRAEAAITDYPAAIKLIEDFESHNSDTRFTIKPIGAGTFSSTDSAEEANESTFYYDRYGIPVAKDQGELLQLINESIGTLHDKDKDYTLLNHYLSRHIKYDKERFTQPPLEIDW